MLINLYTERATQAARNVASMAIREISGYTVEFNDSFADSFLYVADAISAIDPWNAVFSSDAAADFASVTRNIAYAADVMFLEQTKSIEKLIGQRLWLNGDMGELKDIWQQLKKNLLALNEDWDVWIEWYEDILLGRNWAGLPDDLVEQLSIKITEQENKWWERDSTSINADIKKWHDELLSPPPPLLDKPEPQNAGAIRFLRNEGEPIGIDYSGNDDLLDDEGAVNRHSEVKRLVNSLLLSYDPTERGANSVAQLIGDVKNYQQSLGDAPKQANIDFLIPRGEGLRMMLEAQENIDDFSDLPPISDRYKLALGGIVKAHNAYVSLDPALAKRDEALLGPDVKINLIAPDDGMELIKDAVEAGIAKPEVAEALSEEAKVAPKTPDAENRKSRRFSEGVKNFVRKVVADSKDWIVKHQGKLVVGGAGIVLGGSVATLGVVATVGTVATVSVASYSLGKWMLDREKTILKKFEDKPIMIEIIKEIYVNLKKFPFEKDQD